jgi:hypothetical protein
MTKLAKYEAARAALAAAHRVDEVKDIRDKAQAMAAYARQARDTAMVEWATEIKVRAERRCGELLRETAENGQRARQGRPEQTSHDATFTLADLGLTRDQSSCYQKLAAMPEEHFETAIETAKAAAGEVTTAHMLRLADELRLTEATETALRAARADAASRVRHPDMWPRLMAKLAAVIDEIEAPGLVPPVPDKIGERAKRASARITDFLMTHVRDER